MSTPYTPPGRDPTGNPHPPANPPPQPAIPSKERPLDEPQREDLGEHYLVEDDVLPILKLDSPCSIRIDLRGDEVLLFVGPRDWSWKRGFPVMVGCGTQFDPPVPDEE